MELQLVNFKQATALKELGFPQLFINIGYYEDKKLHHSEDPYLEVKHLIAVAPTLELVAKWLRDEKSIDLYVRPYFEETDKGTYIKSGYTYEISSIPKECLKVYPTYEEALSAGIDKVIKILKNNDSINS